MPDKTLDSVRDRGKHDMIYALEKITIYLRRKTTKRRGKLQENWLPSLLVLLLGSLRQEERKRKTKIKEKEPVERAPEMEDTVFL